MPLINLPSTIKTSGMDGNNTRMGPKIRPKQLQGCSLSGWTQLSEAGPEARGEKCTRHDQRRTSADQHGASYLISTGSRGELSAYKMNVRLENLQRGFSPCPNATQYFN